MSEPQVIFNVGKNEQGNPSQNYKKIVKKYKGQYKFGLNKDDLVIDKIRNANLLIFGGSRAPFTEKEIKCLEDYLISGGNLLILFSDGGESKSTSNLNAFIEKFGIYVNNDCVVRTCYFKYFHPKEAYIQQGVINQEIVRVINGEQREARKNKASTPYLQGVIEMEDTEINNQGGLDFVYPNGATLIVKDKAFPILSTGPMSYPCEKPIMAINQEKGKLVVIGSTDIFNDEYFEKDDNQKIFDFLLKFFFTKEVEFDKKTPFIENDCKNAPDIAELSDKLKSCLQESEELPKDVTTLFDSTLFKFDLDLIPDAVKLYETLQVKHEPLTLIVPQFETPLLGLQPAVFPPIPRELPPPPLELFDLDEEFASEKVRLAQLTNKCTNEDLEYYVKEAGDIIGITDKLKNRQKAQSVIHYVLENLINFKKLNQG
ncbi:unnamed protein product [Paramecium sonneborni]|uniref:ABC-type uncharacterized transport system domain-containing protein n=1 Tax=Paramecium sonneborni TaxID=65129 RepID=A0A8S1QYP6_9CILI|nr:unnamed protein product [Paramecium sonneborni]